MHTDSTLYNVTIVFLKLKLLLKWVFFSCWFSCNEIRIRVLGWGLKPRYIIESTFWTRSQKQGAGGAWVRFQFDCWRRVHSIWTNFVTNEWKWNQVDASKKLVTHSSSMCSAWRLWDWQKQPAADCYFRPLIGFFSFFFFWLLFQTGTPF